MEEHIAAGSRGPLLLMLKGFTCNLAVSRKKHSPNNSAATAAAVETTGNETGGTTEHITVL